MLKTCQETDEKAYKNNEPFSASPSTCQDKQMNEQTPEDLTQLFLRVLKKLQLDILYSLLPTIFLGTLAVS